MKKLYTSIDHNRSLLRMSKRAAKRRKKTKERNKLLGRLSLGVTRPVKRDRNESRKYSEIKAPNNFSFISNPNEVLDFFYKVESKFKTGHDVFVNLSEVDNLTNDAIVLLLSKISNQNFTKGRRVKGNNPKNEKHAQMLKESGFFEYVFVHQKKIKSSTGNKIITKQNKKVEPVIAQDLIINATAASLGEGKRCQGIYKTIIECMANTCDHAMPNAIAKETWWLSVFTNANNKSASFAFIDNGVGIFESVKIRKIIDFIKQNTGFLDHRKVLKDILEGKIGSRTGISYRGKGLPAIYNAFLRNSFSRLIIISNNVFAEIESNNYLILEKEFHGTFIYWELNKDNLWSKL